MDAVAEVTYAVRMRVAPRDSQVVKNVARFHQLSSTQIFELVFSNASKTPCDRTLKRLTDMQMLARIERRTVGGSRGGSGQYVYQLGREGHALAQLPGRYSPMRAVSYHSLQIADAYLVFKRLERDGHFTIAGFSTEPDCHVIIGNAELKPDLYIELDRQQHGSLKLWLEIDMGTQGQRQIKDKFERYWYAYNHVDSEEWPVFPRVVFVAIDDDRARELVWLLEQGPKEAVPLFTIVTLEGLSGLFGV